MKLIFCPKCQDIFNLKLKIKACNCQASWGKYLDDLNAIYGGAAIPLGISNPSFIKAIVRQPKEGLGKIFEAFVIPKKCPTFKLQIKRE